MGQKEPPRLGSMICYGQELATKSHRDSAVRFVAAKHGPERAIKTRQYDLLRPRLGQKEPPRLGNTICYGQTWARKSHQDSAVRFVTTNSWPERATETRQYDLLRPRVGQKEPPRLGSTISHGQGKSHQDSAVRFVTAKRGPERAIKTVQKKPPRLGNTICSICYGQTWTRKSHPDSAVRFVTAEPGTERATNPRQYDLLRPNVGQKEPPRLGSTICYGQELARKSHQDSAVRFVMAKRGPEKATKTRQYDLLRPRVGQKEPPRLGSTICYGQTWVVRKSHRDSAVRFVTAKSLARKSHQDSAVRFVTAETGPERATKTRQYDLLRPNVGQKEPRRLGSTICYGQELARKSHRDSAVRFVTAKRGTERATKTRRYNVLRLRVVQKESPRLGSTLCYGHELGRKNYETRQYDLLWHRVVQKEHPRLGSTFCYGQTWARKRHQDSEVRFVLAKCRPERATETRQYDLLRPRLGRKEPPRLGSTLCYGHELGRKNYETRQYNLLRPNVGQTEPLRIGSTICCGQTWARKSHQDSEVRFVTATSWPERATETRQYNLLRLRVVQKESPRLGSTICYGQELARKSHQDSAVRFVTA